MNSVDIGILVILGVGALTGLLQGFIVEIAGIFGAILAFALARTEYRPVRHVLAGFAPHSPWLTVVSYLIVFMVVWGAILFGARLLRRAARLMMLGPVDRAGGALIGLLQSALILGLLLYIAKHGPNHSLKSAVKHSTLAPGFLALAPAVHHLFPTIPK